MTIAILGAGRLGRTLARLFLAGGHTVRLANSRGPASLAGVVAGLGPRAEAVERAELLDGADVVLLTTQWQQTAEAVAGLGPWEGRVVVDTTNNRYGTGPDDLYDIGDRGASEVVADLVPGARLVKAFNHAPIPAFAEPAGRALFIAGDDADAKALVGGLIREAGGEPVDTGGLRDGGRLQASGPGPLAGHGRLLEVEEAQALLREARAAGERA